jgi:hypothetical protein
MSKRIVLATVALFVFSGCSTIGRGGASQSADASDSVFGEDVGALDVASSDGSSESLNPGQMEVSWQDNGQSIRPLSQTQAHSMKVPATKVQKRANLTASKN